MSHVNRLEILFLVLCLAACSASHPTFRRGGDRADDIAVMEVNNLAGVSLKIPAIYFGDALGAGNQIKPEKLDLCELSRAGILSYLTQRRYRAALCEKITSDTPKYELHAAITQFNLDALRATGRLTLGIQMMLVDAQTEQV